MIADARRRELVARADLTATIREMRRGVPVKPNGHRFSCVCRDCFEAWQRFGMASLEVED